MAIKHARFTEYTLEELKKMETRDILIHFKNVRADYYGGYFDPDVFHDPDPDMFQVSEYLDMIKTKVLNHREHVDLTEPPKKKVRNQRKQKYVNSRR